MIGGVYLTIPLSATVCRRSVVTGYSKLMNIIIRMNNPKDIVQKGQKIMANKCEV